MARAIWSGAISFGLVNVPVKLFSATSPKAVRFHQLSGKTGSRIKQKRVDASTGDEVPFEDIVKGYELGPDRYVLIDPASSTRSTRRRRGRSTSKSSSIWPISTRSTTTTPTTWRRARAARRPTGCCWTRCGSRARWRSAGSFCAPSNSCARCEPTGDVLTLSTMLFGDEVVPPSQLTSSTRSQINRRATVSWRWRAS